MEYQKLKKIALIVILSVTTSSVFAGKITKSLNNTIIERNAATNYVLRNSQNNLSSVVSKSTKLLVEVTTVNLSENDRSRFNLPGVTLKAFSIKYNRVSLELSDFTQLATIEKFKNVVLITKNYGYIKHVGAVTSRALVNMNPPTPLNVTGVGQKIGILSDSFARTPGMTGNATVLASGNTTPISLTGSLSQLSGDLPATVDLRNDNIRMTTTTVPTDEGAAMAELAYDIAPGSAIAFNTVGDSQLAFANAITELCTTANSTVVVDDILFLAEPVYQAGIIAQAATDCAAGGVAYFSAAGNSANDGIQQKFKDISATNDTSDIPNSIPTGVDFHDWGNGSAYLKVVIPASGGLKLVLQWNQPFESLNAAKGAEIDLNLRLYATPDLLNPISILTGTNIQGIKNGIPGPSGDAFEKVNIPNNSTTAVTYYVAIDNFRGSLTNIPQDAGTPLEFSLAFYGSFISIEGIPNGNSQYGASTIYGHSGAAGVISVAAVAWFDKTNPESFSSRGGDLTVFFDKDGNFNPVTKFVPDIAAIDGNNTTFFGRDFPASAGIPGEPDGFPNFNGTSAAAPNAAAVAMLALEMNPALTPDQLVTLLQNTATDITGRRASVGVDDVTGAGLINITALLAAAASGELPPLIVEIDNKRIARGEVVNKNILPGATISFNITANDVNGDIPVISVTNKPANATFVDNLNGSASFSWVTSSADNGTTSLIFTATDGNPATPGSDTVTVNINVNNPDVPVAPASVASNDSGGCSVNKTAGFDPLIPALLFLLSMMYLLRKQKNRRN